MTFLKKKYVWKFLILATIDSWTHWLIGFYTRIALRSHSHLSKKYHFLLHWKSFKNNEECFLFHLKSSFRSQVIQVFIINFLHIMPSISWSKGNQTIKLGQLIEYNKRNIFLQKLCKTWGTETSSRPLSNA